MNNASNGSTCASRPSGNNPLAISLALAKLAVARVLAEAVHEDPTRTTALHCARPADEAPSTCATWSQHDRLDLQAPALAHPAGSRGDAGMHAASLTQAQEVQGGAAATGAPVPKAISVA